MLSPEGSVCRHCCPPSNEPGDALQRGQVVSCSAFRVAGKTGVYHAWLIAVTLIVCSYSDSGPDVPESMLVSHSQDPAVSGS